MRFAAIILSNASKVALPTGIGISMKIPQIAPLSVAVPPKLYGGTERIVAHLSNALVELGHQVTLFASADADTRATLVPVRDQAIRLDPVSAAIEPCRSPVHAARAAFAPARI